MPFSNTDSLVAADANNMLRGVRRDNTTYSNTGNTNENDMASWAMTGGTMTATGALHIMAAGTITGAAGTKRIRLYFGATVIVDTTAVGAGSVSDWWMDAWVYNTASAAQRCVVLWHDPMNATNFNMDYITAAIDTTASVTVKVTAQNGAAGDTITETTFDAFVVQIA